VTAVAALASGVAFLLGAVIAVAARKPRTLRAQLVVFAVAMPLVPLAVVLASGAVMFDSEHDLAVLGVAAASSTAAVIGALLFARSIVAGLAVYWVIVAAFHSGPRHQSTRRRLGQKLPKRLLLQGDTVTEFQFRLYGKFSQNHVEIGR